MKTADINKYIKRKNAQIRRLHEENYVTFTERAEVQQLFGMIIKNKQLKYGGEFYTYEEAVAEFEERKDKNEVAFQEPLTRAEYNAQVEKFIETYGAFSYQSEKKRWYENFRAFYEDFYRFNDEKRGKIGVYSQREARELYEKAREMADAWRDSRGYAEFSYDELKKIMGGAYDSKQQQSPPAFMEFLDKLIAMPQGDPEKW